MPLSGAAERFAFLSLVPAAPPCSREPWLAVRIVPVEFRGDELGGDCPGGGTMLASRLPQQRHPGHSGTMTRCKMIT
jgi:hypothetical protein